MNYFYYQAFLKLFLSNDLFWGMKVVLWLFFEIKLELELNNLLNNAIGVRIKKNIIESKILGTIWLKIYESLNHIISIIIDNFRERTPIPENNNDK